MPTGTLDEPTCVNHPDREHAVDCRTCGKVVCHECRTQRFSGTLAIYFCNECERARLRRIRARKLASGASIFGILALLGLALVLYGRSQPHRRGGGEMALSDTPVTGVSGEVVGVRPAAGSGSGNVVAVRLRGGNHAIHLRPAADPNAADDGMFEVGTWSVGIDGREVPISHVLTTHSDVHALFRKPTARVSGEDPHEVLGPGDQLTVLLWVPSSTGVPTSLRYEYFPDPTTGTYFNVRLR